jgi:sugar/nucleoside kinase (ribokinase family)
VSDFACAREFDVTAATEALGGLLGCAVFALVGQFNLPALTVADVGDLLRRARRAGMTTVLDTGWDPHGWSPDTVAGLHDLLPEVDVFLPNQEEAGMLTGRDDAEAAAADLARAGARTVVVKCGADGSHGRCGTRTEHVPALPVRVHDTVGAGDAYDAGFVAGLLRGEDLAGAMALATATASVHVGRATDRHPTFEDVLKAGRGLVERGDP